MRGYRLFDPRKREVGLEGVNDAAQKVIEFRFATAFLICVYECIDIKNRCKNMIEQIYK